MKTYALPPAIRALVFDLDGTLYQCRQYMEAQESLLVARLARHLGEAPAATALRVERTRAALAAGRNGRRGSFGAAMLALGVSFEESACWRAELFEPERYLSPDPELDETLDRLGSRFALAAASNNATAIVRRTLACLGVIDRFRVAAGIEEAGVFKPDPRIFTLVLERLGVGAREAVSLGDRFDVDIEGALALGMGGILVEGRGDLLALPELLLGGH